MFCGPPMAAAIPDMLHLRFYEDQLYNVHSREYSELYEDVIPRRWKVWGSLTRPVGSNWASSFLVSHSLCRKWWEIRYRGSNRLGRRDCAWHQMQVLVPYPHSWANDTLHARNYVFKVIRARVCRQWLARVRVHIGRADWCDDVVAGVVCQQLEAWFARLPHADVRWSTYVEQRRQYRVCWWNS